jgi:hypothetical protein
LLRSELGKIGPISQVSYRGRAKPAAGSGESPEKPGAGSSSRLS